MGAPSTYKQLLDARKIIRELQQQLIEERQNVEYMKGFTLRQARGDILPFEKRYAYENLYFRDKDLKEEKC